MKVRGFLGLLRPVVLLTVVILGLLPAMAGAQPVAAPPAAISQPTTQLVIPPPQLRTWQEMEAAAEAAGPPPPPRVKPFRPTMGEAAYKSLKAKAPQAPPVPAAPGITAPTPLASTPLTSTINFAGVNSGTAGGFRPPDTEGAVGLNHFVEITNSHLDIYLKAAPNNLVKSVPLSSFFGYTAQSLFDPRVIYDSVSARWIISADAFAESPTVQKFFFAVSSQDPPNDSSDPTGAFYIYNVNVSDGLGGFWDFPQVGQDRNAVIFTANFFDSLDNFIDARMFTVAKFLLYNGPGQTPIIPSPHLFTGLAGTLSAPIVLDTNPNTYLVAADLASSVTIYTLTNSAANPPTLSAPAFIPVPTYTPPLNAPQPNTGALLDTSDGRFVNAGTQIGNSLFQVHSIASGGFARCRFYEFDTVNKQVIQSGDFGSSSTSFDFNASIAANRRKDVFVTWSATDTSVNAEVRFSGRLHTDPLNAIPSPGSLLASSATFYRFPGDPVGNQRWGDYSAVSLDPADPSGATAWIVNETIPDSTSHTIWGSRIGCISLPRQFTLPAVDLFLLGD